MKLYETEGMYRHERESEDGNPLGIRFEVHTAGEQGLYNEIAVDCFVGQELVASMYIGLDQTRKDVRILTTADGDGGGDHKIAVYPMRSGMEAVESNYN